MRSQKFWQIKLISIGLLFLVGCGVAEPTPEAPTETVSLVPYTQATATQSIVASEAVETATPLPLPTATPVRYTIVSGDTLLGVASRYGLTLDQLLTANPSVDPRFLSVGLELVIPAEGNAAVVAPSAATPVPLTVGQPTCTPDALGGQYCVALLSNQDEVAVENVVIVLRLYDEEGEEALVVQAPMLINRLPGLQTLPVVVYFPPPLPLIGQVTAQLLSALPVNAGEVRYLSAESSDVAVTFDQTHKLATVAGVVTNLEQELKAENVWIMAVGYDNTGAVVATRRWESPSAIDAGATASFSLSLISFGGEITEVDLFVEARP